MASRWKALTWCVAAMLLAGCRSVSVKTDPPWNDVYRHTPGQNRPALAETGGQRVTCNFKAASLSAVAAWWVIETGTALVYDQRFDERAIDLVAVDVSRDTFIELLSRCVGAEWSRVGSAYYVGQTREEDFMVAVVRSRRLDAEQIRELGRVVGGAGNRVAVSQDGVAVIVDKPAIVRRYLETLDSVERVESVAWAVQLYIVAMSEDQIRDVGLDVRPSVDLSAALAGASGMIAGPTGAAAAVSLDATLRAVASDQAGRVVADPLLLLVDGVEGSVSRRRKMPVRTVRVTTSTGASTEQSSFEQFESGLRVDMMVREVSDRVARLTCRLELGELDGYLDGVPIIRSDAIDVQSDVQSGGVYLLGSVARIENQSRLSTWLSLGSRRQSGRSVLQVWARVLRVGVGGAGGDPSGVPAPPEPERVQSPVPNREPEFFEGDC